MTYLQKILTSIGGIAIVAFAIVGFVGIAYPPHITAPSRYGAPVELIPTSNTTNTTSSCNPNTASIILASSSARILADVFNEGTSTLSLCLNSATCVAGQGYQLVQNASGTVQSVYAMVATQPLWGPISCIMNSGATSTVGLLYSQ